MSGDTLPRPFNPRDDEENRVVRGPHPRGTPLDLEPGIHRTPLPGAREGFVVFVAVAVFFASRLPDDGRRPRGRLRRARPPDAARYLVWHNDPPKLAAVGFVFPPLTTTVLLPLGGGQAPGHVADRPAAGHRRSSRRRTIVVLDRTLARCDMPPCCGSRCCSPSASTRCGSSTRGNGMSEALYSFFLAFSALLVRHRGTRRPSRAS